MGGKAASRCTRRIAPSISRFAFRTSGGSRSRRSGALLVDVPGGYRVPLNELADVKTTEGPTQISREDGQRRIGIEMNVVGRDIGSFVREAQTLIAQKVAAARRVLPELGRTVREPATGHEPAAWSSRPSSSGSCSCCCCSRSTPSGSRSLVLINLPFAMMGGVFALFLTGLYLSVPASVGLHRPVRRGRAQRAGADLVHLATCARAVATVTDAVRTGCETRLRPVLMTATIAIFSLIPMVFATGPGSEIQRPLAVVVIGGLVTSTCLTLLVLPILYTWVEERRRPSVDRRPGDDPGVHGLTHA